MNHSYPRQTSLRAKWRASAIYHQSSTQVVTPSCQLNKNLLQKSRSQRPMWRPAKSLKRANSENATIIDNKSYNMNKLNMRRKTSFSKALIHHYSIVKQVMTLQELSRTLSRKMVKVKFLMLLSINRWLNQSQQAGCPVQYLFQVLILWRRSMISTCRSIWCCP